MCASKGGSRLNLSHRALRVPRGYGFAELVLAGCLHVGHVGTDEKQIEKMVAHVKAGPNRWLVLLGDMSDGISVSDHRFNPREVAPWIRAHDLADRVVLEVKRAAKLLAPIKDRILAYYEGNHERKVRTAAQVDLYRLAAELLETEPIGAQGFLRLTFEGRDRGASEPVTLYFEHGSGGASSPEAVLSKLKKQAVKHPGAEAYIGSHHHKTAFSTLNSAGVDARGRLRHDEVPIVTVGTFLSYYEQDRETYGQTYQMPVPSIGPAKLRIQPWIPRKSERGGRVGYSYPWWA